MHSKNLQIPTAPNLRYVDSCLFCEHCDSDSVCKKHKILINLHGEPTICDDFKEFKDKQK